MKRIVTSLVAFAVVLGSVACNTSAHAQSTEGPANPAVYACIDNTAGIQSVRWVTSLPCTPPLLGTTQEGQPSQTVFTAAFNADGTLAGSSALSGNAADNTTDGVYSVTFTSAFANVPTCQATLIGANSSDFQIEISNPSRTGVTVAIQSNESPYAAAAAAFVVSCSDPQ